MKKDTKHRVFGFAAAGLTVLVSCGLFEKDEEKKSHSNAGKFKADVSAESSRSAPSVVLESQNTNSGANMPGVLALANSLAPRLVSTDTCSESVETEDAYLVSTGDCVHGVIRSALKYECFNPGPDGVDFCPSAIPASAKASAEFKFSETALLGSIYHAVSGAMPALFPGRDSPKSIAIDGYQWKSTTGFKGAATTDGDPTKYIINVTGLYDAIRPDYRGMDSVQSTSKDGKIFAFVSARKNEHVESGDTVNRISQGYVSMLTSESSKIVALNAATGSSEGSNPGGHRNIAVMNTVNHHFVVKQINYVAPMGDFFIYGTGGRDPSTGAPYPGFFYAKVHVLKPNNWEGCVNNETMMVVDASNCADLHAMFTEDHTALAAWMDLSAAEVEHLSAFLDIFATTDLLPDSAMPTPDEDWKNWPDTIVPK
jgi:hypothetical protein